MSKNTLFGVTIFVATLMFAVITPSAQAQGFVSQSYRTAHVCQSNKCVQVNMPIGWMGAECFDDSSCGSITYNNYNNLVITTDSLPSNGKVGNSYYATISGSGGAGSYSWSLASGSLPPGLSFSQTYMPCAYGIVCPNQAIISGTPTASGTYWFLVKLTDGSGNSGVTRSFTITINQAVYYYPYVNFRR